MVDHSLGWFSTMKVLTIALLLVTLQSSHALSPTSCDASEPSAEKVLDLINKGRRNGYAFQLLRVSDAHLDTVGNATVYYFVLDVKESDCWVLSTKSQNDCLEASRPSEIVIGQCKVIATRYSNDSQDCRVNHYNCTTSSVSSALSNTEDSPVLLEYLGESEVHRQQAHNALEKYKEENDGFASFRVDRVERVIKASGGERTNYYVDFSMRNCSTQHFHRRPPVFGFCRAVLSYNVDATDLETPESIDINCEVSDFEQARNASDVKPHWGREHFHFGKHPHGPHGHEHHGPPPPHGHPPHGPPPHGCPPHGPPPHRHPPHGPPPHGHPPHGPPPHGHPPHGPPPHGHPPHGPPPHGHDFHDYGPCDPPSNDQEHRGPPHHRGHGPPHHRGHGPPHHRGHGPPHGHSGKRGKGFPFFHHRQVGSIYRLPPLNADEVLAMPEANFPSNSMSNCKNPLQPEIQPFPEVASESCPGKFKSEFPQISKFFANVSPK
uniref:histidine-rich glycoprotein isoform X1 n=1 Tax=Myodes glareolus TaxID=447135 RepID=UPI002020610F|nr:histidine-rich glycoprotein isoform X1 [Myodes glareolus]